LAKTFSEIEGLFREVTAMTNPLPLLVFFLIAAVGVSLAYGAYGTAGYGASATLATIFIVGGALAASAIKVADQWTRVVVLRLGRFHALRGPGLFFIIPIIDTLPYWIDTRVITSAFKAERTLTKDTVPVDVDAVLFWKVVEPQKAALDVAEYQSAIAWASQTALRDVIGKTVLADMLEGRQKISDDLRRIIDERAKPWGIDVISVEIRDVLIPSALEDAMSMQAQAERERQARVILGDSERQVAAKFVEAAHIYASDPTAFHLRAMNMLYEGLKQNATVVIVPSTAIETMQLGGVAGLTALATGLADGKKAEPPAPPPSPREPFVPPTH
jgi:regulator of protease activity HflC (stomatin/prohibitin superfamily)